MLEIDGSRGEGGGQVLRSALSLSCLTKTPFTIRRIRGNRSKPGLMRQHLVAVQAAASIAAAEVSGASLGSGELSFRPRGISPGHYRFDIGTAGSVTLVLQTLILPLLFAAAPSRLTLTGGTHVPFSPSWNYLAEVFQPALRRLGVRLELVLDSCGFYPKGGGRVHCAIHPCTGIQALPALERGPLLRLSGCSAVANLPLSIAQRQRDAAREQLAGALEPGSATQLETLSCAAIGQGTFLFLKGEYEGGVAGTTALGARGKRAELVGQEAAAEFLAYHKSGMRLDQHLADQLVLYLALADGPSLIATSCLSEHLRTNLELVGLFVEMDVEVTGEWGQPGTVRIAPRRAGGKKGER